MGHLGGNPSCSPKLFRLRESVNSDLPHVHNGDLTYFVPEVPPLPQTREPTGTGRDRAGVYWAGT